MYTTIRKVAFISLYFLLAFISVNAQTDTSGQGKTDTVRLKKTGVKASTLSSQPTCSVSGPNQVTVGVVNNYTISCDFTANLEWHVSHGTITQSSASSVSVRWDAPCTDILWASLDGEELSSVQQFFITVVDTALGAGIVTTSDQTINNGGTPTVMNASAATGGACSGSYTYQWQKYTVSTGWVDIAGATAQNYQPGAINETTSFRRKVTCGSAVVYAGTVTVTVYPQLQPGSLSPANTSINNGSTAPAIGVSPTGGNGIYSYQWESSPDGSNWTTISGATGNTYSGGSLTASIYYRAQVTSNGVSAYSNSAYVNVYPVLNPGTVTPGTQSINYNTAATLLTASAATGGNGTYTYQWQYLNESTWTDLAGETNLTYAPGALSASASYRVVFTSNGVTATSNAAVITVYPELVAGVISPASQSVFFHNVPGSLTVTSATGGNGIYDYEWQVSTDNVNWSGSGGGDPLSISPGNTDVTTYYRVRAKSNGAIAYTNTATVAVYPTLVAGSFGQDSTAIYYNTLPGTLTITAPTGGNGTYMYQWLSSTNGTTWTVIPNEYGLSYTPPALKVTTYYKLTVISGSVSATSNTLKVKVYPLLNPGSIRVVVTNSYRIVNYGGACGVIINQASPTGGDGTYTAQWQKSTNKIDWFDIPEATSGASYTGTEPLTDTTYYRRVVTSFGVSLPSNFISIYVLPPLTPGIAQPPIIYSDYYTLKDTFRVTPPSGGNGTYTYQWVYSTDSITWTSTSVTSNFYVPNFTRNTYVRCNATSNGVTVFSNVVKVVYPLYGGVITYNSGYVKDLNGQVILSNAVAASGGYDTTKTYAYSYQYSFDQQNWIDLPSNTLGNITRNVFFRRKVVHGSEVAYSNIMTVLRLGISATTYIPNGISMPSNPTETAIAMPVYSGTIDTENLNYVKTREFTKPGIINVSGADSLNGVFDVRQVTAYLDGLGRPLQTVAKQATPLKRDLVSTNFYDVFGREAQSYLPYVDTVSNNGKFKTDPSAQQPNFYNSLLAGKEAFYYSNTIFEPSPLNRVVRATAAGKSWSGQDLGVIQTDRPNDLYDDVRLWTIGDGMSLPVMSGSYPRGKIMVHETVDENGGKTIEYKDFDGRVVMKKVNFVLNSYPLYNYWLMTYYVYDDIGNLRFVISPKATQYLYQKNWVMAQSVADELCFQYVYDARNRMIAKKVPGAGIVNMVYDARDRVVMVQDSVLNVKGQWNVTLYDELNRPVKTALWNNTIDATTHRQNAYNSLTYPAPYNNYTILTETFYDDYSWLGRSDINQGSRQFTNKFNNTTDLPVIQEDAYPVTSLANELVKGLVTGTRIRVLDTSNVNNYLLAVSWYDDRNRVIQVQSQNVTGAWDTLTTKYDFSGKVLSTCEAHATAAAAADIKNNKVVTAFSYDHGGRLLQTKKYLDGSATAETVAINTYDELSRLKNKTLGEQRLDSLGYDYNIRGWLNGINADYVKSNGTKHWFGMKMGYDYGQVRKQFNGNISEIEWQSKGDGVARGQGFVYDQSNRLNLAHYAQYSGSSYAADAVINYTVDSITYDFNGNLTSMRQFGLEMNSSTMIDRLIYGYQQTGAWSNKLAKVDDNTGFLSKLGDFKDGANTGDDYAYDGNGNMVSDANKKINNIAYNHLNLPQVITVDGKGKITYIYDAAGNKLKKITQDDSTQTKTVTTYIGGYVYKNDTLQFINQEEGRIRPTAISSSGVRGYNYDYFIKDHLGNVRMVLTEERQQDVYPVATLETSGVGTERNYYNIDTSLIVDKANLSALRAANGSDYKNNNGNPPYNNNPAMGDSVNAESQRVYKLNGANGQKLGLGITLKVMSGDTVSIFGKSFYHLDLGQTADNTAKLLFDNVINSMFGGGGFGGNEKGATSALLLGSATTTVPLTTWLNNQPVPANTKPKAYLNWILLDEQFRPVSTGSGFDAVGANDVITNHQKSVNIAKNGYLYVYCSNESNIDVFFDNLQVIHSRGPLLEETHYYPFGSTMAGISSKAIGKLENKKGFNDGNELQNKEFSDGSGLEWYDAKYRLYDPQIGRFFQLDKLGELSNSLSLYAYTANNPILHNDPLGLDTAINNSSPREIEGVVVKTGPKGGLSYTLNNSTSEQLDGWIHAMLGYGHSTDAIRNWVMKNDLLTDRTKTVIFNSTTANALAYDKAMSESWKQQGEMYKFLLTSALLTCGIGELQALTEAGEVAEIVEAEETIGGDVLTSAERLRIENAATRINKPINVVGSRASGRATASSDWDYVIEKLTNSEWKMIKNSLPGARSVLDNTPRMIDIFKGAVDATKPFITITPR